MSFFHRAVREPLVHFLLLGGLLFVAYSLVNANDKLDGEERTIVVDRDVLLSFMQFRAAAFEPEFFEAQYDALSEEQVAELAREYVREEAMAREARALGLDEGDYVIRRRLVQKIEYLVTDTDLEETPPTEAELRAYFEDNKDQFRQEAEFTFTQVFVDAEKHSAGDIAALADQLLRRLRADGASFNDATAYGDRFPYQQNYINRTLRFVENQFGPDFAAQLDQLQPGEQWQGPVQSQFGSHLVLLTGKQDPGEPRFEQVREMVALDLLTQRREASRAQLLDELVDQYVVRYQGVPEPGRAKGASDQ